jgi:hypothetical protein
MSLMAFKMMMQSGVLRPGDIAIRRGPGGLPLAANNQLPDFLNYSLDVLFGPESNGNCAKSPLEAKRHAAGGRSSARPEPLPFSLKTIVARIGLFREDSKPPMLKSPSLQNSTATLEKRVEILESLLKTEHARCQKQVEELAFLRSQMKPIDELQADLVIEREAGRQLVQWLQESEQQLADVQNRHLTSVGRWPRKASYFPEHFRKEEVPGVYYTKRK